MLLLIMLVKFDALAQQLAICSAVQPARHYMLICYSLCNLRWDVVDMAQLIYQSAIFVDYLTFAILSLESHDEII